jgi:hypothetical protein
MSKTNAEGDVVTDEQLARIREMLEPSMRSWQGGIWTCVLPQEMTPRMVGEPLTIAVQADPQGEIANAMRDAWAVLTEHCELHAFLKWLERRGFGQPPLGFHWLLEQQCALQRRRIPSSIAIPDVVPKID